MQPEEGTSGVTLPRTLRVGPIDYLVSEGHFHGGQRGEIDILHHTIEVHGWIGFQQTYVTIWHELTHAILDQAGYYSDSDNERLITAIANGVVLALRDNEWLRDNPAIVAHYAK